MTESTEDDIEQELRLDRRVYGSCYWKVIDGKKVRIHPRDIRYIKGVPRDSANAEANRSDYTPDQPEIEKLRKFFLAVCDLTLNHDVMQGNAVVYPAKLGPLLEAVDQEWWTRCQPDV